MKSSAKKVELAPYDDLFSTEESRQDAKLEKVREIPLSELHPFKNHPFKVKDDEAMLETADSVRQYGILVPAIARPDPEGGYELVAGHRRHRASELAEKETMPVIVRDLDDDAATIIMVDSNLQRESLLPSERAFAYKMKLEAMKHQGARGDLTSSQVGYDDEKLPFDPSLMVYFRKRLTPEVLGEINEMIMRDAKERQVKEAESKDDDDDSDGQPGTGGNSGTMIVDATCAPSNIRYPQDVSLLNEARENAEKLLDVLHDPADGKKPRTYRKRARKDYLKYTRCRKHTAKMTRKAIGKRLAHLRRDLDAIDGKLSLEKNLPPRQTERLDTIRNVYEQQKYMYDNRTHSVPDRIVSVSQPFVRPIVRGKAGKPVEFGAKLDISVVDGWTRLECCSFDTYNEAGNLREMAERFRAREGHYSPILTASALRWKKTRYLSDASQIFIRELKSFCDGLNRWY